MNVVETDVGFTPVSTTDVDNNTTISEEDLAEGNDLHLKNSKEWKRDQRLLHTLSLFETSLSPTNSIRDSSGLVGDTADTSNRSLCTVESDVSSGQIFVEKENGSSGLSMKTEETSIDSDEDKFEGQQREKTSTFVHSLCFKNEKNSDNKSEKDEGNPTVDESRDWIQRLQESVPVASKGLIEYCVIHDLANSLLCLTCEIVFCCHCLPTHSGHDVIDEHGISNSIKKLQLALENIKSTNTIVKLHEERTIKPEFLILQQHTNKCLNKYRQFKNTVIKKLDQEELRLKNEIDELSLAKKKTWTEKQEALKDAQEELENVVREAESRTGSMKNLPRIPYYLNRGEHILDNFPQFYGEVLSHKVISDPVDIQIDLLSNEWKFVEGWKSVKIDLDVSLSKCAEVLNQISFQPTKRFSQTGHETRSQSLSDMSALQNWSFEEIRWSHQVSKKLATSNGRPKFQEDSKQLTKQLGGVSFGCFKVEDKPFKTNDSIPLGGISSSWNKVTNEFKAQRVEKIKDEQKSNKFSFISKKVENGQKMGIELGTKMVEKGVEHKKNFDDEQTIEKSTEQQKSVNDEQTIGKKVEYGFLGQQIPVVTKEITMEKVDDGTSDKKTMTSEVGIKQDEKAWKPIKIDLDDSLYKCAEVCQKFLFKPEVFIRYRRERLSCLSGMPCFQNWSFEEIRWSHQVNMKQYNGFTLNTELKTKFGGFFFGEKEHSLSKSIDYDIRFLAKGSIVQRSRFSFGKNKYTNKQKQFSKKKNIECSIKKAGNENSEQGKLNRFEGFCFWKVISDEQKILTEKEKNDFNSFRFEKGFEQGNTERNTNEVLNVGLKEAEKGIEQGNGVNTERNTNEGLNVGLKKAEKGVEQENGVNTERNTNEGLNVGLKETEKGVEQENGVNTERNTNEGLNVGLKEAEKSVEQEKKEKYEQKTEKTNTRFEIGVQKVEENINRPSEGNSPVGLFKSASVGKPSEGNSPVGSFKSVSLCRSSQGTSLGGPSQGGPSQGTSLGGPSQGFSLGEPSQGTSLGRPSRLVARAVRRLPKNPPFSQKCPFD